MDQNLEIQTQLFVGQYNEIILYTKEILQKNLCKKNSCRNCITCKQISQKVHTNILWLVPDKQYTLDQIEVVFEKIIYSLAEDEKFFVIFEYAELLNQACSNKLLKPIEEPKPGYYFIFLTNKKESILSTIRSRCIIKHFYQHNYNVVNSSIGNFFVKLDFDSLDFLKIIEKSEINEYETVEVLNSLIQYWSSQSKKFLLENYERDYQKSLSIIKIFNQALQQSPMPGGSKIFWKNLFIKMSCC